jgi:hypothetical protein
MLLSIIMFIIGFYAFLVVGYFVCCLLAVAGYAMGPIVGGSGLDEICLRVMALAGLCVIPLAARETIAAGNYGDGAAAMLLFFIGVAMIIGITVHNSKKHVGGSDNA